MTTAEERCILCEHRAFSINRYGECPSCIRRMVHNAQFWPGLPVTWVLGESDYPLVWKAPNAYDGPPPPPPVMS